MFTEVSLMPTFYVRCSGSVATQRHDFQMGGEFLSKRKFVLFRQELFHMQREFLKERTRCRALEEELENPMNVHRWRKLEVQLAEPSSPPQISPPTPHDLLPKAQEEVQLYLMLCKLSPRM